MALQASTIDALDFEGIVESAAKTLLQSHGITGFTSAEVLSKRQVPRAEIVFQVGAEAKQQEVVEYKGRVITVPSAFGGTLTFQLIVGTNDYATLRSVRSAVRYAVMLWASELDANFPDVFDGGQKSLALLSLSSLGTSATFNVDGGLMAQTMRWNVLFGTAPGTHQRLVDTESAG